MMRRTVGSLLLVLWLSLAVRVQAETLNPRGITPAPGCTIYKSTDVPQVIPDGSGIGATAVPGPPVNSVIHVPAATVIGDLNVVDLQATHGYPRDIEFRLRSPNNTEVILVQRRCGGNDNFNLSLDDSAALTLESLDSCNDGEAHQPEQQLSAFNGQNASGQWTLVVRDQEGGDVGTLTGWSLQICTTGGGATHTPTPTPTPPPQPCGAGGGDQFLGGNSTGGAFSGTIMVPPGLLITPDGCKPTGGTCTITPSGGGFMVKWMATLQPFQSGGFEVHYVPADDVPAGTRLCTTGTIHNPTFGDLPGGSCITACGRPPGCVDYYASGLPKDLPGFGSPLTSTITLPPGVGAISSLSVLSLSADTFNDRFYSFHLVGPAPAQTNVPLINERCAGNEHFFLRLEGSAELDLTDASSCSDGLPHKPEGSLSAFNGQNASGTWTLRVDTSATDLPGQLAKWGLRVCAAAVQIPTPTPTRTPTRTATPTSPPGPCTLFPGQSGNRTFQFHNFGQINLTATSTVTLPPGLSAVPGTCTSTACTCNIVNASTVTCVGLAVPDQFLPFTFTIQAAPGLAAGTQLCSVITATTVPEGPTTSGQGCEVICATDHTPTPTATRSRSATPTRTYTHTATRTFTPSVTPTPSATPTGTRPPTLTPTRTGTPTRTHTPSPTKTFEQTHTPTVTPTATVTPRSKLTYTPTPTEAATVTPTITFTATVTPVGRGGGCSDGAQCVSGNCVDGRCCASPSCPTAEFCSIPMREGVCSGPGANSAPCDTGQHCDSGKCVDGFCCATATCPSGEFCNTGECQGPANNGTPCSDAAQCGSGNCVDGFCCATATCPTGQLCATGQCEGGPEQNGAPCSNRLQCRSGFCVDGFCCGTEVCPDGQFCNAGTCDGPSGNGTPCSTTEQCQSTFCVDGTCCAANMCPPGQLCDIPNEEGMCAGPAPLGNPCVDPAQCQSDICTDGECCDVATCPVGQACDVPGSEGHCNPVPTPTPGTCGSCVGDCTRNCVVTVDELILMVNIALDDNGTSRCVAGDASGDGHTTINEIIAAVNNALFECSSSATPTPTVGTGRGISRRAAGPGS